MKNSMQEIVTKSRHLMEAAHTTLTGSELQVLTVECIWWHGNRYYCSRGFLYIYRKQHAEDGILSEQACVNEILYLFQMNLLNTPYSCNLKLCTRVHLLLPMYCFKLCISRSGKDKYSEAAKMPSFMEDKNITKLRCAEIKKVCTELTIERDCGFL